MLHTNINGRHNIKISDHLLLIAVNKISFTYSSIRVLSGQGRPKWGPNIQLKIDKVPLY
jgi:hypothetical protein